MINKETISTWFKQLQNSICADLEKLDGSSKFQEDLWQRQGGGGGRTRIIRNGDLIEKGGVNFSAVHGKISEKMAQSLAIPGNEFYATGVSIVLHPNNPHVPIIHANVRYFETDSGHRWFGGGIDISPHYIYRDDAIFFHSFLKKTCDEHDVSYYPKFKKWADDYFFIPHRNETRGVGGIFFDRLSETKETGLDELFGFVKDVGNVFIPAYTTLANRNRSTKFSQQQKDWQLLRRGRYVEFNLVYDLGTKFGLVSDGRTESILMSLPAMASWEYAHTPLPGSEEELTLSLLRKDIDWAGFL